MATATVPNTFANGPGNTADATQVNGNFNAILGFLNSEVVHRDASIAFTAIPSGPASNPTLANQFTRKQYVDDFIPAGVIMDYAGAAAPSGWVFADGATYDGTNPIYARLFAAIGLTYGGTGNNFQVPNTKGRVRVGVDAAQSEFNVLGETGGAKTHALTTGEMPVHSHGVTDAGHTHPVTINDNTTDRVTRITSAGGLNYVALVDSDGNGVADINAGAGMLVNYEDGHGHTGSTSTSGSGITIQNQGGGGAHNNLQPYIAVHQIIKL